MVLDGPSGAGGDTGDSDGLGATARRRAMRSSLSRTTTTSTGSSLDNSYSSRPIRSAQRRRIAAAECRHIVPLEDGLVVNWSSSSRHCTRIQAHSCICQHRNLKYENPRGGRQDFPFQNCRQTHLWRVLPVLVLKRACSASSRGTSNRSRRLQDQSMTFIGVPQLGR